MSQKDDNLVDQSYECDQEFLKLLTRTSDVDLTTAALELARDAYPGIDFRATLNWIDDRAGELSASVARAKTDHEALLRLTRHLSRECGIYGDQTSYDCADSSYLHRVIETKRGIPISLSLLYMAVGQRVGIDLQGVSAPMHFLTRYESVGGPLFVDAFSHGRILDERQCTKWLHELTRYSHDRIESTLEPVGPRMIIIRMLNNLKALHVRLGHWPAAWLVQHRLTSLNPASYSERRDLALISLRADRPGYAADLIESCLRNCPENDLEMLKSQLDEAHCQLSRWN